MLQTGLQVKLAENIDHRQAAIGRPHRIRDRRKLFCSPALRDAGW
jgi:hypothetical protein